MRAFHRRSYSADPNVARGVSLQQIGGDEDLLNELLDTEDGSRHGPRTGTSMHEYLLQRQGSLGVRTHDPSLAMLQPSNDAMAIDRTSWLMNAVKGGAPWQLQEAQLMQPFPMQQSTGTMQQQTTGPVLTPPPPRALDKPHSSKVITDTQASLDSAMEYSLFEPMALPNSARPNPNHGKGHLPAKGLALPHVHAGAASKGLAARINATAPACMETEDAKRFAVQTRANAFDPSQLDPDRAKRIVANRLSAHRSRQKKLNYMNSMQGDIVHVSQNTLAVVAECQRLIALRAQSLTESDQLRLRVAALAAQVKAMEEHQNTLKSRRQQIKDYTEVLLAERRVKRTQAQPSRSNEASTLPVCINGDLPQLSDSSGQRGVTGMTPLTASVARTQEAHHQAAMADSDGLPSSSAGGAPAGSGGLGSGDLAAVRGLRVSAVDPGQGRDVSTSAPPTPATLVVLPTPWTAQQLGPDMSQHMPGYVSAPQGAAILPPDSPLSAPLPSLQQPQSQLYTTLTNPSSTPSNPRNSSGSQQHPLPSHYHQHSSGQVLQQAAAVLSNDDLQAPRMISNARPSQAGGGGVLSTPSWSNSVAHTPATNHSSPTLSQGISLEAATLDPALHATHGLSSVDNPSMHQPPPVTTQWDARAITAKEHMYGKFAGRLSGTNHVAAIPVHSPLAISRGPSAGQPSSTGALCALQQQQLGSATAAEAASPSDSGAGGGGGGATTTTSGGCAVGNGASQGNNKAESTSPASSFGAPRLGTLDSSTEWAVANLPTCPLPVGIKDVRRFLASDDEPLVVPGDDAKAKPLASGGTPSGAGGDAGNRMGNKSVVMETTSVEEPTPAPIESLREELLAVTNPLNAGTGGGAAPGIGRTDRSPSMDDSPNIIGGSPSGIGGSSPQGVSLLATPSAPMFGSFSIPFASQSTLSLGGLGTVSWLWSNDVLGAPAPGSNSAMDINRMSVGEGEIARQSAQGLSPEELENQVERLSVGLSRLSHEESLRGNSTRFPPPGTNQSSSPATPQGGVSGGSPEAGRDSGGVNGMSPRLAGRMSAMLGTGMMPGGGGSSRGQMLSSPSRLRHGQFVADISRMSGMMPGSGPVSGAMEGLANDSDLDQLLMSEMSHG